MNENNYNINENGEDRADFTVAQEILTVPNRSAKLYFTRVGLAIMVLTLINLVAQLVFAEVCYAFFNSFYGSWQYLMAASTLPLYALAAPAYFFMLPKKPKDTPEIAKKEKFGVKGLLIGIVISFAATAVFNYASVFIVEFLKSISGGMLFGEDALTSVLNAMPTWAIVILTCIIAPIGEELLFRKLLVDRLLPFGGLAACIFSGLAFGLFHGNLRQFVYAFPIGVIFAYIYIRSGNILYPIAAHAAVNLTGSVITPTLLSEKNLNVLEQFLETQELTSEVAIALLSILGFLLIGGIVVVCGIVAFILVLALKKVTFTAAVLRVEGSLKRVIYANIGCIAALVAMLLLFVLDMCPWILGG